MEVGFKIVDAEGNLPKAGKDNENTEYIAPVNLGLHALFKSVDLYFNDVLINLSGGFHHYKEYLKALMSYNEDYKSTVLKSAGWDEDDYAYPHSVSNRNEGFWDRLETIAKCNRSDHEIKSYNPEGGNFIGPLGIDYKGTPIINGINIRLQYVLNDADFFLFGRKRVTLAGKTVNNPLDKKFKYVLHRFTLHVLVHELQPSIYESIETRLKTQPLISGFKRYNVLQHSIPVGLTEWVSDQLLPS